MKKIFLLAFVLIAANAHALESHSCSEKLDDSGSAAGKTNIGLGTEKDGSSKPSDWVFTIDGKVTPIGKFAVVKDKDDNRTGYIVTTYIDKAAGVGHTYEFNTEGCEESKGKLEKRNLG